MKMGKIQVEQEDTFGEIRMKSCMEEKNTNQQSQMQPEEENGINEEKESEDEDDN